MESLRMCVVCRQMKCKNELLRAVKIKGEVPKIDLTFKAQGRGAYICKKQQCICNAEKRRVFERALKGDCKMLYKSLENMINE